MSSLEENLINFYDFKNSSKDFVLTEDGYNQYNNSKDGFFNKVKNYATDTFNTYKPDEKGMIVSDKAFESLDSKTQTILASIAWQYGVNRNKKTGEWILKEFWDIRDNKSKISKKLKGMAKLEYTNRRNTEANYIKST